jgi:hypothetical protein
MVKKNKKLLTKRNIYISLIVLVALVGFLVYWLNRSNSLNLAEDKGNTVKGTTSTPTKPELPTNNATTTTGGVTDNKGVTTSNLPPSSLWVSSSSGDITLQEPSPNTTVQSGDTLSGTASVSNVGFILTDSSVGLIDQGTLTVVNGKFSGQLGFTPHATSGKLEVYYPNPNNGAEEDIIEIDVNFNF